MIHIKNKKWKINWWFKLNEKLFVFFFLSVCLCATYEMLAWPDFYNFQLIQNSYMKPAFKLSGTAHNSV